MLPKRTCLTDTLFVTDDLTLALFLKVNGQKVVGRAFRYANRTGPVFFFPRGQRVDALVRDYYQTRRD